jgi:capsular polysaccharide biosynthesis protein
MLRPPAMYSVGIRFTASQSPTSDNAKTFQDLSYIPWLASEYAVNNLASWMRTDTFAREIAASLATQGRQIEPDSIRAAIVSDSARSIMTLFIRWPDAEALRHIAQAAVDVLRTKNATYFAQFGAQPAQVIALDGIIVTPEATPLATRLSPLIRIVLGLAAGLALAFMADYFDRSIRDRTEVEALGLTVIAEIPGL